MARTILDYIVERKVEKTDKKLIAEYLELMHRLTIRSAESFMKLYELVANSNDKKLRKESQRLFGKTVVEIAASLHRLNEIEEQLLSSSTEKSMRVIS